MPPRCSGANGALVQPSPAGTTSRCPAKAKWREPAGPRRIARQFSTGPSGASPATKRSTSNPSGTSIASNASNTSPRAGVTLSQAISLSARLTTSLAFPIACAVDQRQDADQPEDVNDAQDRSRGDPAG